MPPEDSPLLLLACSPGARGEGIGKILIIAARYTGFGVGASSSGNAAKKTVIFRYVCGKMHMAINCPNKLVASKALDKESDKLPSSAGEPRTYNREHSVQSVPARGPKMVTQLEPLSGCIFTDPHAD